MKETQIDLTLMGRIKVVVSMGVLLLLPPLADCIEKEPEYLTTHSAISSTPSGEERQCQQKKELTVQLIYGSQELQGREVSGIQWTPDGEKFTYYQLDPETKRPCIWSYDLKTGKREVFIDWKKIKVLEEPKTEKRVTLSNYFWSPTGEDILLPSGNDLYLYHIASDRVRRLTHDEEIERSPRFSPDGKKIAFIKNHNIQVLDIESGEVTPLTIEGKEHILIGQFDWVYEEEFGIHTGFFWAPDSQHIAYFQLDETRVPECPIVDFIPIHNELHPLRYPKAGDKNSIVQIGVVSVDHPTTVWTDLGEETNIYIPRIKWLPDSKNLAVYRLNRGQNKLELLLGDIHTGKTRTILVEEAKHGWIDIDDDLTFLKDSKQFLRSSDRDGFKHLYLYDIQGKLIRQLTKTLPGQRNWQVDDLVAIEEKNKAVYFRATEKDLRERHLYRVNFNGKGFKRLSRRGGWHQINMAPDGQYYLDFFSNLTTPTRLSLHTNDGKMIDMIEPNEIEALKEYGLSTPEFLSFESDDGIELNAFMIRSANFDPAKKYPVLIYTYGGPGSQIVLNAWDEDPRRRYLWHQMMAQKGYIIFGVDNRGTGGRGRDWMTVVYRRLGELEVKDQVAGVKYLRTLPYVDGERIGIWGWSYGGYTTCMCLLKGAEYFKVGVAVAPVTDWRNYDTIYTERYVDTPQDNPEGYKESSAVTHAENLKGKLLLVHGTSDDNVHVANTLQLAFALQNAHKPFDLMIYPRKMHHIGGQDTRVHLFNLITDYIVRNL